MRAIVIGLLLGLLACGDAPQTLQGGGYQPWVCNDACEQLLMAQYIDQTCMPKCVQSCNAYKWGPG